MFEYRINKTVGKLFVASLLASLLTACAGSSLTQIKPTDALEPNKGLVIVRIVSNEDFVGYNFDRSWDQLSIRLKTNEEEARTFKLTRTFSPTMRSTQIFSNQLPEGTYNLLELRVSGTKGNFKYNYWLPLDNLGTFKIVSGHITNLGTIICQPVGGNRYQFIHTNIDSELHEMIANSYPVINKIAAGKKMIGWENESILENTFIAPSNYLKSLESRVTQKNILNKSATLSFAKENSAVFNNPRQIATGEIFAGSKLGQVLVKERDGKWSQLDTGFTREITAVLPIDRNTIFAGGEEGMLLLTNDGGRSWKKVGTPLKTSIFFLEQVNGRFFIGSDLFYETRDIYSNNWKVIDAIKPNKTYTGVILSNKVNYPQYASYIDKGKFYLFIPYNSTIFVLDLSTNIWSTVKTPFDDGNIYSLKNGFFYNVGWSLWLGPQVRVSHDFGNSWKTINDNFGILYSPVFKDNQNGFVLRYNGLSKNVTLRKTHDGGENWKEVNDFNDLKLPHPTKLFYDYVNNKLYYAVDGMIYIASDDLQTWTRVR